MANARRNSFWLYCYSLFFSKLLTPLSSYIGFFVESLSIQKFSSRNLLLKKQLLSIARERRTRSNGILIFCSSAGEYEQAKPLGDLFFKNNTFVIYVFFSINGLQFAKTRGETGPCVLLPLEDLAAIQELYLASAPQWTVIVRHELWPAFLHVASQHSQVWLVNALVPSKSDSRTKLRAFVENKLKSMALKHVDFIVAGNQSSKLFHRDTIGFSESNIFLCGDTKFDRVDLLRQSRYSEVDALKTLIEQKWSPATQVKFVAGSVYLEDMRLILEAIKQPGFDNYALIVVPHDIGFSNVSSILNEIRVTGHFPTLLSDISSAWAQGHQPPKQDSKTRQAHAKISILIVDSLGLLSDLYALADLAWVGGACHKKVHNVLEAIVCGVPTACGPHYKNSAEAIEAVELGILEVCQTPQELGLFAQKTATQRAVVKEKSLAHIKARTGVFLKIFDLMNNKALNKNHNMDPLNA